MSKKHEIYKYENGIKSLEFLLKNTHLQTVDSVINENQKNRYYSCEGTLLKVNNISKIDLSTVIRPTTYNEPISQFAIENNGKTIDEYNINIFPVDTKKVDSTCGCEFFDNFFNTDVVIDNLVFTNLVSSIDNSFLQKDSEIKLFLRFSPKIEEIYSTSHSWELLKNGGRLYFYRLEFEDCNIDNQAICEIKIQISHSDVDKKEKYIDFQFSSN